MSGEGKYNNKSSLIDLTNLTNAIREINDKIDNLQLRVSAKSIVIPKQPPPLLPCLSFCPKIL